MIIPNITIETSEGIDRYTIQDDMFKRREIECIGEINEESVNAIISQLLYLHHKNSEKEITIYINSPGGDVSSGLALYDIMQAVSCPIRTVCVGTCASMAAVLFTAGDVREILPHGRVMIHDPLISGGVGGNALSVQRISENLMHSRQVIGEILSKHTGKPLKEIYKKTAVDSFFYAEEAVKFGLADRIITTIERKEDCYDK